MSQNKLYNELKMAFPTREDLLYAWELDVKRGAEGETPLGFIVDFARDLGHCKSESWYICMQFLKDYNLR